MDLQPHRCPACQALVVDRRWPNCTTCQAPLPKEWIMSAGQVAQTEKLDQAIRAQHVAEMKTLDPSLDPNVPGIVKALDSPASRF